MVIDERWIAVQAWSSGLERGLGLGADVVDGLGGILGAVHGGTGNEHVGAGLGHDVRGLGAHTAIDLDAGLQATAGDLIAQAADFDIWLSRNFWPPKPGSTVMMRTMSNSSRISKIGSFRFG